MGVNCGLQGQLSVCIRNYALWQEGWQEGLYGARFLQVQTNLLNEVCVVAIIVVENAGINQELALYMYMYILLLQKIITLNAQWGCKILKGANAPPKTLRGALKWMHHFVLFNT